MQGCRHSAPVSSVQAMKCYVCCMHVDALDQTRARYSIQPTMLHTGAHDVCRSSPGKPTSCWWSVHECPCWHGARTGIQYAWNRSHAPAGSHGSTYLLQGLLLHAPQHLHTPAGCLRRGPAPAASAAPAALGAAGSPALPSLLPQPHRCHTKHQALLRSCPCYGCCLTCCCLSCCCHLLSLPRSWLGQMHVEALSWHL